MELQHKHDAALLSGVHRFGGVEEFLKHEESSNATAVQFWPARVQCQCSQGEITPTVSTAMVNIFDNSLILRARIAPLKVALLITNTSPHLAVGSSGSSSSSQRS